MYDRKVVRRRRAALAVFVVLSIAILTAYFGESGGGFFHTLQRGAQEAVAPIETGASRALKPVRDLFSWGGDTIDAKAQNSDLKTEVEQLRAALAKSQTALRDAGQLKALASLHDENYFPQSTAPVTARVIARSSTVWYSTLKVDKGSSDGLRDNQPVIAAGGLIGKLTSVTGGTAEVRLITDGQSGVSAQVFPEGVTGVVRPEVGNPDDLLLEHVESGRRVTENTLVITSGFTSSRTESLFPRGIPIGRVTKVDLDELETYQRVHFKPFADMPHRRGSGTHPQRRGPTGGLGGGHRRMILSVGAFVRVGGLLLLTVVLQLSALSQLDLFGGHADLVILVVAAVAYYGGSVSGCATGFTAGLLLDLLTGTTMGASSLVLTAVGYGVGRFREVRDPSHGLLPLAVGTVATACWVVAFAAVALMLDIGARVSPLVLRDMIVTVLLNALLALPVFTGTRKLLRPSLAVDPLEVRRRRRPPREAGPLGLRGLEI